MNSILDIDAILEGNTAGIQAAPDYNNPPAGRYRLGGVSAKLEKYKSKDKDTGEETMGVRFRITHKVLKTYELAKGSQELPVADGTMFSLSFLYSEEGIPFFKKYAQEVLNLSDLGETSYKDILEAIAQAEFDATISIRITKNGDKTYENVNVRPQHAIPPVTL